MDSEILEAYCSFIDRNGRSEILEAYYSFADRTRRSEIKMYVSCVLTPKKTVAVIMCKLNDNIDDVK